MCVDWLFARAKNLSSSSPALKSTPDPPGPFPLRFFWPQLTRLFEIYPQLRSPTSSPQASHLVPATPNFARCPESSHGFASASRWVAFTMVGLSSGSDGKASTCNANSGSFPGSGRSPGEGNGNPLQYSSLENPMDRGAWQAIVYGATKSQTWLSD